LKNLDQESSRHWSHIDSEYFDFELVHEDAITIRALSKSDMIQFFEHYVSPSSTKRAKLAIHLHAQGSSAAPPTTSNLVEKTAMVVAEGLKALKEGSSNVDDTIAKTEDTNGVAANAYVIGNVRDFKSMLAVSAGPQPVKDLSEFEDIDSKL